MKVDPRLHHQSQIITPGNLEIILEMYELLGCKIVYGPILEHRWAMVGQEQLRFAIQIVEVDDIEVMDDLDKKRRTHVAFLSDDPQALIKKVGEWAKSKNIKFRESGWNEKERYFDLPDIFINSVIEVMHTSIDE